MGTFVRIAWRNMWRNPRRSGLVVAAMAVGLWGLIFSLGFMDGMSRQMIDNTVDSHMGHLQVHNADYQARVKGFNMFHYQLDKYISDPGPVEQAIDASEYVVAWSPRIITTGLATNAQKAAGVAIVGIDPKRESEVTNIARSLVNGRYIEPASENTIFIGEALAKKLGIDVGSKIVLMAQDIHRDKAMAAFRVVGTYKTVSSTFDKSFVYISIGAAQKMLGMAELVNEFVILVDDPSKKLEVAKASVAQKLDKTKYSVMTWREIWPLLVRIVEMSNIFTYVFFILIFIAMAFGIANAVLMAVFERIREFGIMKALGAKPSQVFLLVAIESICLGIVGVATGILIGWATVYYFGRQGVNLAVFSAVLEQMGLGSVIYTSTNVSFFIWGGLIALVTAFLSSLWPASKAAKLVPVDAIRHV